MFPTRVAETGDSGLLSSNVAVNGMAIAAVGGEVGLEPPDGHRGPGEGSLVLH